jgi:hypothetical protein
MIFILMRECNRQAMVHCERKDNYLKYESTQKVFSWDGMSQRRMILPWDGLRNVHIV